MHPNSMELMQQALKTYGGQSPRDVLDVGSLDVNGTYRELFLADRYVGCDLCAGVNVDVVVEDPFILPFADKSFDLVVSGQTLEHSAQPWSLVKEMARVARQDGIIIIIVPWAGPRHHEPDCFRISVDGMRGIATYAGLREVYSHQSPVQLWEDTLIVLRH